MRLLRFMNRITPPILWDYAKRLASHGDDDAPQPFVHESVGSHSQYGEDLVIDALLGCPADGIYVDVGANHPETLSNTLRFSRRGWSGINIEPDTELWSEIARQRHDDINLNIGVARAAGVLTFYKMDPPTLSTFDKRAAEDNLAHPGARIVSEIQVAVAPLCQVLDEHLCGRRIDFLTVDAEGLDLAVLESNDWHVHRPRLVMVEIGWRRREIVEFLEAQGYTFVWSNTVNGIFMDADRVEQFGSRSRGIGSFVRPKATE